MNKLNIVPLCLKLDYVSLYPLQIKFSEGGTS